MERRRFLQAGAALSLMAATDKVWADTPPAFPELPRDMDPFAKMSGPPLFTDGPLSSNSVSRNFGVIANLAQPLQISFETANGTRKFSDLTGKVRLLALWAEWCPPCLQELGEMSLLQRAHGDDTFEILAVATSTHLSFDQASAMMSQSKAGNLALWLEHGNSLPKAVAVPTVAMPGHEGAYSIPCVVLMDAKGVVRGRMMGMKSQPVLPSPPPPGTPEVDHSKDIIVDTITTKPYDPTEVRPSIWTSPDAGTFIDALKAGALDSL